MLISVSDLKLHVTCPMKFNYAYRLKRGIDYLEDAQDLGTVAHDVLRLKLQKNDDWKVRVEDACKAKEWPSVKEILKVWEPDPRWEIIHVEKELRLPIGQHTLVGRPDAVVRWLDGYWHLQHKTMASSRPPALFAEVQRTDWHEAVYQRMLEAEGFTPFKGTILNMIRKLALKNVIDDPMKAVEIAYLPRSKEEVDKAMWDIGRRIERIDFESLYPHNIEMTRQSCGGMFGNRLCAYKGVCDGWLDINSPSFVNIEPRYGEENE